MRKRYALVGVGSRGYSMFAQPLVRDYADVAELVALCDVNAHRLALANRQLETSIPTYGDYEAMLLAVQPDAVIVCTVDRTHRAAIVAALEAGCDVITEKPLATTAHDVRAILEAERNAGKRVRVAMNARYGAESELFYRLLRQGVVGEVFSAEFAEYLDTSHGADYFRRWHRRKQNSGGLLVHKASHHFDQLNWWIGADPEMVYAMGARRFYGATRAERGERCLTCAYAAQCAFHLDLRHDGKLSALYLDGEKEDGYYRDRCVFAQEIDIEDTIVASIRYANGVLVNYGLTAYAPYEGQRIAFAGATGRMEADLIGTYHGLDEEGRLGIHKRPTPVSLRVSPLFGRPYDLPIEERAGGHGGADERIREHLFREGLADPLNQRADSRAGAMSVLVGVAANQAISSGQPVHITDLMPG